MDCLSNDELGIVFSFFKQKDLQKKISRVSKQFHRVAQKCPTNNHFSKNGISWSPTMKCMSDQPVWPYEMKFLELLHLKFDCTNCIDIVRTLNAPEHLYTKFLPFMKKRLVDITLNETSACLMAPFLQHVKHFKNLKCCTSVGTSLGLQQVQCQTLHYAESSTKDWLLSSCLGCTCLVLENTKTYELMSFQVPCTLLDTVQALKVYSTELDFSLMPFLFGLKTLELYTCTIFFQRSIVELQDCTPNLEHFALTNSNVLKQELDLIDCKKWPQLKGLNVSENFTLTAMPEPFFPCLKSLDISNTSIMLPGGTNQYESLECLSYNSHSCEEELVVLSALKSTLHSLTVTCINYHNNADVSFDEYWTYLASCLSLKSITVDFKERFPNPAYVKQLRTLFPNILVKLVF